MKICLYLEFYNFLGGILFKNTGTGLLSSYKNQKRALQSLGVEFTEKWDDSCDILQINTPWLKSLYLIRRAKRLGKKVIIWSHVTAEDFAQVFWFNKFLVWPMKRYLAYAYGCADLVFCPSVYTKSLLVAYGLPEKKLMVQSNGVDLRLFYKDSKKRNLYRRRYGLDGLVIGTAGLVIPRKGVDVFLELAAKYPQYQFIWFGKIYSKLMAKGLPKILPPNVKFTGYIDDMCAAFNALDIFIFPSYEENQGMVILEAAAVGLPILVRDIPVYNPWLKNGENCLKAKDNADFGPRLERIIADDNLNKKLREGAAALAREEDIDVLNKKLMATYKNLLSAAD
jgi:1,2-diacylglycerol-3-alpha-glucose alpha-1,2-glucosyltransferase